MRISLSEKREEFFNKYSWMFENITRYKNTLVAPEAIKKYGIENIRMWLCNELDKKIIFDLYDTDEGKDYIARVDERRTI